MQKIFIPNAFQMHARYLEMPMVFYNAKNTMGIFKSLLAFGKIMEKGKDKD